MNLGKPPVLGGFSFLLEHNLERQVLRFDPVVKTGFQKEPCLNKVIERCADSIRIDNAIVKNVQICGYCC